MTIDSHISALGVASLNENAQNALASVAISAMADSNNGNSWLSSCWRLEFSPTANVNLAFGYVASRGLRLGDSAEHRSVLNLQVIWPDVGQNTAQIGASVNNCVALPGKMLRWTPSPRLNPNSEY